MQCAPLASACAGLRDGRKEADRDIHTSVRLCGSRPDRAERSSEAWRRSIHLLATRGADARFPVNGAQGSGRTEHASMDRQRLVAPGTRGSGVSVPSPCMADQGGRGSTFPTIAYGPLNPDNMDALLIVTPWKDNNWGRPCPVSIRFRYRYDVTRLYCGACEKVCNAARKIAPAVKGRFHAWSVSATDAFNDYGGLPPKFQFGDAPGVKSKALVARARRIGISKRLRRGSNRQPAWLRHASLHEFAYFPSELGGQLYVGAAGRWGVYPANRLEDHWLFIVFRAPNVRTDRLVVLSAFTVHRLTSAVRSITARNESASASAIQSATIPRF